MANFNATYVVELDRWGIKNDGTDAINTTKGINNALIWALENDYIGCKLPKGNYLIDKDNQITMVSNMTLDLHGCLIKKETNGYQGYEILKIDHLLNATIIGGIIEGDKNTHDYNTIPGTHEWGTGINISASRNTKIDSVEIKNTSGYGISIGFTYNHIYWVYRSELESGTINTLGEPSINLNWVRSNKYYSLSNNIIDQQGYFMVCGNGYGNYGTGFDLAKKMVTVFFYDNNNKYLGQFTRRTYEPIFKTYFPVNAAKFKISFRSKIQDIIESTITIRADGISQFVNISNCHIHDCRTLGIVGGGQFITIENCEISGIGGAAPGFGIDLEDGYNLNQNVIVRNNHFHDNKNGDIVTVSSRNVLLEMNKFNGTVSFGGGRGENYVSQYNEYNGTTGMGNSLAGGDGTFAVFRYDHMTGAQVFLSGNAIYENVVFDDTSFVLQSDQFLTSKFRNCSFNFNKPDTGWSWIIRRGSLYFDRCKFNIVSCQFYYIRDETFANSINTNLTMKNCEIIASSPFGGCSVNNLTLVGNIFKGTYDVNYQYFNFAAKNALISDNIIDSVNLVLNGTVGSTSSINIRNNLITINKAKYNSGPDRNEGIYLKKFDTIYFKYNQLIFQTSITVLAKGLTIYSEKIIELIDNSFLSSNSGNIIELNGAYRTAEDTTPIPKLVAILKGNYYSSNVQELKQTSFYNQLEKKIIGDNLAQSSVEPTSGYYKLGEVVHKQTPTAGSYIGWVCTTEGFAENEVWSPLKFYKVGNKLTANNHVYEAQNEGKSFLTAPSFPITNGGLVEDKAGATTWRKEKVYLLGDCIIPTIPDGNYYECTTTGTTGSSEPAWSIISNGIVVDGSVIWTVRRIIKWKETGQKAAFKPYGLIQS